jgi:hypothetical protein
MEPIACPETSVQSYDSTLRNIPEERRSYIQCSGSLKSHMQEIVLWGDINVWLLPHMQLVGNKCELTCTVHEMCMILNYAVCAVTCAEQSGRRLSSVMGFGCAPILVTRTFNIHILDRNSM